MALDPTLVGRSYPPSAVYEVGRAKIAEFATAIGDPLARAVLLQLEPVGVVPPVLAGDVVAVLALLAGQGDLRTDIGGCHERFLALFCAERGSRC